MIVMKQLVRKNKFKKVHIVDNNNRINNMIQY